MTSNSRIAKEIVVNYVDRVIVIDGHPFPYYVADDVGVDEGGRLSIPMVTVGIFADRVSVITDDKPVESYGTPWNDANVMDDTPLFRQTCELLGAPA